MDGSSQPVLWFTGLSGAGKTTTALHLFQRLKEEGRPVELLDGDAVRAAICRGLGFSREDRMENIRRIAYVAGLLSRHGVTVIVSAITPYREMREHVRRTLPGYVEIYARCPLEICEARDVKGLYAKARRNEIDRFTGISDPYEEPESADLVIDTHRDAVESNAERVLQWLRDRGYAAAGTEAACALSGRPEPRRATGEERSP